MSVHITVFVHLKYGADTHHTFQGNTQTLGHSCESSHLQSGYFLLIRESLTHNHAYTWETQAGIKGHLARGVKGS